MDRRVFVILLVITSVGHVVEAVQLVDVYTAVAGPNVVSTRAVLTVIPDVTLITCSVYCSGTDGCGGFNHGADDCLLIDGTSVPSDLIPENNHIYYERNAPDMVDCASSPCLTGTCEDTGSNFTCHCSTNVVGRLCEIDCTLPNSCCPVNYHPGQVISTTLASPDNTAPLTISKDVVLVSSSYGDGWVLLMRRQDGSVNFTRNWASYKDGFGSTAGEYWIGNEAMHRLTNNGSLWRLRVDMESAVGCMYAEYSSFSVGNEASQYTLHVSGYSGDAGDSLTVPTGVAGVLFHDNQPFVEAGTGVVNCVFGNAGWWYTTGANTICNKAILTGAYDWSNYVYSFSVFGIWWGDDTNTLSFVDMKIKVA